MRNTWISQIVILIVLVSDDKKDFNDQNSDEFKKILFIL